ncbi:MAG TPA: 23S rRNA (guanosine(2251)-2'-O)-methyltransferase RlmB [Xanthomonadaceae bacterium]|nr:23S rRNA (guanosine(2251)-2'-O)-methyltransferase RlmB [Xanthomonadaceae bacterium]
MRDAWLFGIHAVEGALARDPSAIVEMVIARDSRNPRVQALADQARQHGLRPQAQPAQALDRLADGGRHQGVAARVRLPDAMDESDLDIMVEQAGQGALLLVLDGITDPHNLGACLRSADAAGVTAVILPRDRSAALTPAARKIAAGGAESVPLVRVTNLARTLKVLKDAGVWTVGLAGEAGKTLYQQDLRGPLAIVMGSEGEGLRRLTREHCDHLARLPMRGSVESLNVSVATGIALYEALRQRGA